MASKKKSKKKISKKKQAERNKKILSGIIAIIVVVVIAAIFVMYYPGLNSAYKSLDEAITKTDEVVVDKVVASDLDLYTLVEGNSTIISWESSDEAIISNDGKVTRPSFSDGDKIVKLTATYSIPLKDKIAEVLSNALGYSEKTKVYTVKVLALPATASEKVELALSNITLPSEVYGDILLPTKFNVFEDVSLTWVSSKENVISSTGLFNAPSAKEEVNLTLTASCGSISESMEFVILALPTKGSIKEVDVDFNEMSLTSKYSTFTYKGVTFTSARIEGEESSSTDSSETGDYGQRYVTLRSNSDAKGIIEIDTIDHMQGLSFNYKASRTSGTKNSYLIIDVTYSNGDTTQYKETISFNGESNQLAYNFNDVSAKIKITLESEYAEEKVSIDELVVERSVSKDDVENSLANTLASKVANYMILPTTTSYGGSVSYESSNPEVLSHNGVVVTSPEDNTTVILKVTINYLTDTFEFDHQVVVKGTKEATPVEIHFIDIGKYGQSDCGESIYIKYENIDILIDAGDSFEASQKAVSEAISKYLTDGILDYVIATHPDSDHIGGMPNVFETFQIANLIVFDGDHTSQKYRNFVTAYTNENCNVINIYEDIIVNNELTLTLGESVYIEFIDTLYYNDEVSKETNGRSIVFLLHAYETKVLFTGDADSQGAHPDLEENYQDKIKDIDILKVVHHGTREGSSDEFIAAVDPEVAIICNGNYLGNKHSHPHVETITNLYEYDSNMKVYCITGGSGADGCELGSNGSYKCDSSEYMTDRNGTIDLVINNSGYEITSEYNSSPIETKNTTWWKGYLETIN